MEVNEVFDENIGRSNTAEMPTTDVSNQTAFFKLSAIFRRAMVKVSKTKHITVLQLLPKRF